MSRWCLANLAASDYRSPIDVFERGWRRRMRRHKLSASAGSSYLLALNRATHDFPRGKPECFLKRTIETRYVPKARLEGNLGDDAGSPRLALKRGPA